MIIYNLAPKYLLKSIIMRNIIKIGCLLLFSTSYSEAQNIQNNPTSNHGNKFEQLGTILPSPNTYRTASGAPGHQYWQMRADYVIDATLDEKNTQLNGSETITYYNNSPDPLTYFWLKLDENEHDPNSEIQTYYGGEIKQPIRTSDIENLNLQKKLAGLGCKIDAVTEDNGAPLKYTIVSTMMRVDLKQALKAGATAKIKIKWHYRLSDRMKTGGRGGYEFFPEDGNILFTMAQWYPRLCVYSDFKGWQHKQFTGRGEFALTFGNFEVNLTVPSDHIIAATGECQNYEEVLSPAQFKRWQAAKVANSVTEIVLLEEAKAAESTKASGTKTWKYKADNVRDFAWGSSRKFIWDAKPTKVGDKTVMCMSYYPKEAYGLYRKYSTKVVEHTIQTYSKYTINYPYPVAISVEASNGMEYPMICFNFGRTEKDGTYSEGTKNGMISVIIHEVGHNFFPMIINSDERQWSWMDEGINTFVQFVAEMEWDPNYPASRGPAHKIVDYMKLPKNQLEPIMTNSENIINFGDNAYGKPATGLVILRETILGRELFDYAFKEYARRWAFKHPEPADFFRTMEDASGVDLDWFWRGWFYDIQPVDIALDSVKSFVINDKARIANSKKPEMQSMTQINNIKAGIDYVVVRDTALQDFYYKNPEQLLEELPYKTNNVEPASDSLLGVYKNTYLYELSLSNKGGLVMPLIIQWNYADGTSEIDRISVHIWRKNEQKVVKSFLKNKEVISIQLDPYLETSDIDVTNNVWNKSVAPSRFELWKNKSGGGRRGGNQGVGNRMQQARKG
jgi:hypothetical protein